MVRYFLPVFYTLLQLVLLLGLGYVLRKSGRWRKEFFSSASRFVMKVTLPVYFFVKLARTNLEDVYSSGIFPITSIILTGTALLLSYSIFSLLPFRGTEKHAGIALSSFGNSGYLPLTLSELLPLSMPVIMETFGAELPSLYIGVFLLMQSPLLWAVGNSLISGKIESLRLRDFLSPPLVGILLGLLVPVLGLQELFLEKQDLPFFHIYNALEQLSQVTFPLVLIALGAMIANLSGRHSEGKRLILMASVTSSIRLLLIPALFYAAYFLILRPLNLTPTQIWVIFLEMHTPAATNLSVMSVEASLHEEYTAFTLLVSYVAFLFVLPVYLVIFLSLPGILS